MEDVTLQPQTISTVKATAPVLREHGLEITQRMYALLFQDEQIKSLFNQSHHRGVGTQPRSLAGAVHAYAANIDRLEELGPVVERIAQTHVALNVLPEHYPAVGRALLGALRDVLGQAATDEVIAAWTEAYAFLAQILMRREQQPYDQRTEASGGWLGWREFAVDQVVPESEVMTSFYRISVKREDAPDDAPDAPAGLASNYLHDQSGPGTVVRVSAPAGDFFLGGQDGRPLVLLSGGVGLTPILSMLDTLVAQGGQRDVWYVHAALSGRHHAMRQHLKEVVAAHPGVRSVVFYEFPTPDDVRGRDYDEPGRITMDWLKRTVPVAEAEFYFCGPKGFMRMLAIGLRALNVPDERIHFEFFGPAEARYA